MSGTKHSGWVPRLRFPEFGDAEGWTPDAGASLFDQVNDRDPGPGLPVLAITQEHGAIPRHMIDYHVSVSEKSIESYKVVRVGDFIISLRSFQGGIEYSRYHGICSPAYVILRRHGEGSDEYFRHYLKTDRFIRILTKNLEGLRDGKMISYSQFSGLMLPVPTPAEQQKIADCLSSLDDLITLEAQKLDGLKAHKKGLMQQLFPREGETQPRLRFPEFKNAGEWARMSIQEMIDRQFIVGHLDGNHGELYPKAEDFSQNKEGIPYITANDFMNGSVDFSRCKRLPIERARLFKKGVAKDGDILFAHNATVGPVAKLNTSEDFVVLSTTATYFRCNSTHLSNDFLKSALSSPDFVAQYSRVMSQSTRNQVPITTQRKLDLHIPLLPEQQRLASCLSSLDTLITLETQKLEALKTHKKGLMQQLFPQVPEE
ncbi:MAG: restriction endonuclease subunit S [Planctomycetia bacterium]|nr:restriction endonuclease subunit S [Planctomycetia bacterium]